MLIEWVFNIITCITWISKTDYGNYRLWMWLLNVIVKLSRRNLDLWFLLCPGRTGICMSIKHNTAGVQFLTALKIMSAGYWISYFIVLKYIQNLLQFSLNRYLSKNHSQTEKHTEKQNSIIKRWVKMLYYNFDIEKLQR